MAHSRRNVILLFAARSIRLFAYGALSVVLALYLHEAGLSSADIGLLFTLTLAGDAGITLWITTTADRFGRKKMLLLGAGLMVMAGVVFSLTGNIVLLMIAGIIGVISPSGNEIGPFLSLEQAALSQMLSAEQRTRAFGWYNLAGSLAAAAGALAGGFLSQSLINSGLSELESYRAVILGYAACGIVLMTVFSVPFAGSGSSGSNGDSKGAGARAPQVKESSAETLCALCPRRLCRRVRDPEHGGLLVPYQIRS